MRRVLAFVVYVAVPLIWLYPTLASYAPYIDTGRSSTSQFLNSILNLAAILVIISFISLVVSRIIISVLRKILKYKKLSGKEHLIISMIASLFVTGIGYAIVALGYIRSVTDQKNNLPLSTDFFQVLNVQNILMVLFLSLS